MENKEFLRKIIGDKVLRENLGTLYTKILKELKEKYHQRLKKPECKIYIVNKKNHQGISDFLPALKYTTLPPDDAFIFITQGHIKTKTNRQLNLLQEQIREKIRDSNPEDFLFINGEFKLGGLVMAEWFLKHQCIKSIRFDSKEKIKAGSLSIKPSESILG